MGNLDIGLYLLIARRRIALLIGIVLVALAASMALISILTPLYVATAKILVEAPQIPTELARSTIPTTAVQQFQLLRQQITSRNALLALARTQKIYGTDQQPSEEEIVSDLLRRIAFDQVQIDGDESDTATAIYAISFSAEQPKAAAKVANALASMIMLNSQSQRTNRADRTLQFFDQQVAELSLQLQSAEAEILRFKNLNRDSLPESLEFRRNQQLNLQERLMSLEREEAELRARKNILIAAAAVGEDLSGKAVLSTEQQLIVDLNRALSQQLTLFREDSPNVVSLRQRISSLQRDLVNASLPDTEDQPENASPKFGLNLQLKDIDARLRTIVGEKTSLAREIEALTASIAATPATETALSAMTRRHENAQTQYNAAVAGRAEALTGTQIENRSEGARFSLLDSAAVPEKPIAPRNKRIVAMGGFAGLALALGVILILEMTNRTVRRPKDVALFLQNQPLGAIPVIRTQKEVRAAHLRHAFATMAGTAAIPAVLAAIHHYYIPLPLLIDKVASNLNLAGII